MRLELTRVGLLVELANHYTTRGAFVRGNMIRNLISNTLRQANTLSKGMNPSFLLLAMSK